MGNDPPTNNICKPTNTQYNKHHNQNDQKTKQKKDSFFQNSMTPKMCSIQNENEFKKQQNTKKVSQKMFINKVSKIQATKQGYKNQDERVICQRIDKSYAFFTELKLLQKYENTFNVKYPIIIKNKNKQITTLRRQITQQGSEHQYFNNSHQASPTSKMQRQNLHDFDQIQIQEQNQVANEQLVKRQQELSQYKFYKLLQTIQRLVRRLHQTGKHPNCLQLIHSLDKQISLNLCRYQVLQKLLTCLQCCNIQLMDMLYHTSSPIIPHPTPLPSKNLLDVKQLIISSKTTKDQFSYYQECKLKGLDIYKQGKVCFYILAGGEDIKFINKQTQSYMKCRQAKQIQDLGLYNRMGLLQILLERYDAFARLLQVTNLTIFIIINSKKMQQVNKLLALKRKKWSKLNLILLKQCQSPILDINGNLILTKNPQTNLHQIKYCANGTGDLWDFLSQSTQWGFSYLKRNKFQYIQVIGTNNILQHCFDCLMLGVTQSSWLNWATKVVDMDYFQKMVVATVKNDQQQQYLFSDKINSSKNKNSSSKNNSSSKKLPMSYLSSTKLSPISVKQPCNSSCSRLLNQQLFFASQQSIHILDPNQGLAKFLFPLNKEQQKNIWTYTNHSIFRISYVQNKLKSYQWKQNLRFHKKVNTDTQNEEYIMFEKGLTDMFGNQTKDQNGKNQDREPMPTQYSKPSSTQYYKQLLTEQYQKPSFVVFKYERQNQYYPYFYKQNKGIYDIQGCSKALSKQYLSYLNLSVQKFLSNKSCSQNITSDFNDSSIVSPYQPYQQFHNQIRINQQNKYVRCYIDPHLSLEGENLGQVKLEIQRRLNQYLLYNNKSSKGMCMDIKDISQIIIVQGANDQSSHGEQVQDNLINIFIN